PTDLTYSSRRQLLAAATEDKGVFVWRAGSGELVAHLPGQWVRAAFAPGKDSLLICGGHPIASFAGRVALWNPSAPKEADWAMTGARVEWSPDGQAAFISSGTGSVAMVDASTRQTVRRFEEAGFVTTLACSPDGKVLGSANWADQVHLWDTATGRRQHELR